MEVKQLKINNNQQHTHLLSSQHFAENYSLAAMAQSLSEFRPKRISPAANKRCKWWAMGTWRYGRYSISYVVKNNYETDVIYKQQKETLCYSLNNPTEEYLTIN